MNRLISNAVIGIMFINIMNRLISNAVIGIMFVNIMNRLISNAVIGIMFIESSRNGPEYNLTVYTQRTHNQ